LTDNSKKEGVHFLAVRVYESREHVNDSGACSAAEKQFSWVSYTA